jgi:hypothetical protein
MVKQTRICRFCRVAIEECPCVTYGNYIFNFRG